MWRIKKKEGWFNTRRNYLHFDKPISYRHAEKIVKNTSAVEKWGFFPFLSIDVSTIKFDKRTKRIKKKTRPIRYASHIDSHIYSYYALLISPLYEEKIANLCLQDCITGFRKLQKINGRGKNNIDFANTAFENIKSLLPCSVLAFDVKSFFDEIDHETLKQEWSKIIGTTRLPTDHFKIYKSLTHYSYVDRKTVFKLFNINKKSKQNGIKRICSAQEFRKIIRDRGLIQIHTDTKGIPQGSPISGLLSNIFLIEFDTTIDRCAKKLGAKYYRYCDDIIIICKRRHTLFFKNMVNSCLQNLHLQTNDKTVERTFFSNGNECSCDKPVQYLGFMFDGKQVLLRSSSYMRFLRRMKSAVSLAKQTQKKHNKIRRSRSMPETELYRKKLYRRYSYLGKKNFISYAHKAANIMNSHAIKKQIKPLWTRLIKEIEA